MYSASHTFAGRRLRFAVLLATLVSTLAFSALQATSAHAANAYVCASSLSLFEYNSTSSTVLFTLTRNDPLITAGTSNGLLHVNAGHNNPAGGVSWIGWGWVLPQYVSSGPC